MSNKKIIAVDLFAGAGGLSYGLSKRNIEVVLANEIDKDFANTYKINHPKSFMINDDIHNINFYEQIKKLGYQGKIDLLCGGPPCQGFSTVGKKNKLDKRNSLFWEFIRAINELEPRFVIFENVAGFKNLYKREAFFTLIEELHKIGYNTFDRVVDISNYGLPQRRLRTIIIAVPKNQIFHFPEFTHDDGENLFCSPSLTLTDAISDLPSLKSGQKKDFYLTEPQNDYQKRMRNNVKILTEHNASNYGEKMKKIFNYLPKDGTINDIPEHLRPKSYFNNVYARLSADKLSPTITRNFGTPSSSRCIHPTQNRALSTREGARLQSFPDDYIFYGSKTSKNLQIGNAVPPILGEVLGEALLGI